MERILLVEDDYFLRKNITGMLQSHGYEVCEANDCMQARQLIVSQSDLALSLLDIMLPDGDGFSLCSLIRDKSNQPILFLTACDDEASVIKGLQMGADDYISKPFREAELIARIQANLRRTKTVSDGDYLTVGDARLDRRNNELLIAETPVTLSPVEYEILRTLMENHGIIVRRDFFLDRIWELDGGVDDNTLTVHISRLRRKVGREHIETIKGFGYRWRD